ncbi:MAG: DUF4249 family protein [Bacteroidetes bacterium]|nr:DUF4249 family protein [Bacteroidota bacterium]MBK8681999.1 DUF4249 family protein [Bacteroidota bacterium]
MLKQWCLYIICGFLFSCDNTIDIDADFTEQMYVYGLLDDSDSMQYIRIQKSFLQSGVSPYDLVGDYQNIYYQPDEISVEVEEWKDNILLRSWNLEVINGDTIGILKDKGLFASSPNILYRFNAQLDKYAQYKFIAVNNITGLITTAETKLVDSFAVLFPTVSIPGFDFTDAGEIYYLCRYAVNARLYDLKMRLYYQEVNIESGEATDEYIDWTIFKNIIGDNMLGTGIIAYGINANAFYNFVAAVLEPNAEVTREFQKIIYTFYAGGEEMYLHYINLMANINITSQYAFSMYSNIENGNGLFSSIYTRELPDMIISAESIDTLACGRLTGNLGFKSSPSNPAYPECSE